MPFDHDGHSGGGGGGGNDGRHEPIIRLVRATLEALGEEGKRRNLCMDCLALHTAAHTMTVFLMQQDAIDMETGEINEERLRRVIQAVMDEAMKGVRTVLDEHQRRK